MQSTGKDKKLYRFVSIHIYNLYIHICLYISCMGSSKVVSRFNWFNPTPLKLSKHFEMKESFMGMHHEKPRFVHLIPLSSMLGPLLPYSLSPTLYEDCSQTCHLHVEYGELRRVRRGRTFDKKGECQVHMAAPTDHTPGVQCIASNQTSTDQPNFNRQSLGNVHPASCLTRSPRHSTGRVSS